MNFYLASRFKTVSTVNKIADQLEALGHGVISTWHRQEALAPMPYSDPRYAQHASDVANRDLIELIDADALVIYTESCEQTPGGLWVEFGYALALHKRIFLVGPQINVFCYQAEVQICKTPEAFINTILHLDAALKAAISNLTRRGIRNELSASSDR